MLISYDAIPIQDEDQTFKTLYYFEWYDEF